MFFAPVLLLLGLQAQRRGDQVAERARVVDVRRGELELLGQVGDEADHAREQALDVARERLDLARLRAHVGHGLEAADEVRLLAAAVDEPDAPEALDEDAQRPVGHLDHLVDQPDRARRRRGRPSRQLDVGVADGDEREHAVAGEHVVDQLDRALLADRERRHRVGEDDRLLERQDRDGVRQVRLGLAHDRPVTTIETRSRPRRRRRDRQHDREQAAVVARRRARDVDVVGERDPALEGPVVELHLLVVAAGRARPARARRSRRGRRARRRSRTSSASTPGSSTTTVSSAGSSVR